MDVSQCFCVQLPESPFIISMSSAGRNTFFHFLCRHNPSFQLTNAIKAPSYIINWEVQLQRLRAIKFYRPHLHALFSIPSFPNIPYTVQNIYLSQKKYEILSVDTYPVSPNQLDFIMETLLSCLFWVSWQKKWNGANISYCVYKLSFYTFTFFHSMCLSQQV